MSTVNPVQVQFNAIYDEEPVWTDTWSAIANGSQGAQVSRPGATDRSVQVVGTFGAGGTLILQGSNDGTNWFTLTDMLGNALSFTAAGLREVNENTLYLRPSVTAGDGTTALTVVLLSKGFA